MAIDVVGSGMIARAFQAISAGGPNAIVCASGVADSRSTDPLVFRRERDLLTELVRRAIAQDSVLVYFSGAPVYGPSQGPHLEMAGVAPESPYGRHKVACEEMIAASGARYLVLRLPNVVGPGGNPSQLIPSLVAQVTNGRVEVRTGATRDLLDVDDVVHVVERLLRNGTTDTILNVASGVSTPVERLAEMIATILDRAPTVTRVEGGDRQEFSTALIQGVLPEYPRFEPNYPATVLTRRVPSIYRALHRDAPSGRSHSLDPA